MKVAGIINLVHYARQKSGYAGAYIFWWVCKKYCTHYNGGYAEMMSLLLLAL